jgi:DNA primase
MISTKNLVSGINDVPDYWIFEHYCNLNEKLTGQDIKIKSLFNPTERTPSFVVFNTNGGYLYKDFSSGNGGSPVKMVMELYGLDYGAAVNKIVKDYREYLNTGTTDDIRTFKKMAKYKIVDFAKRSWTKGDAKFWTQFGIDSDTLSHYNVYPVGDYTMEKEEDGDVKRLSITGSNLYAYTRIDGTVYKMYQPMNTDYKFLKAKNYIQGTDQLKFEKPNLIICSSLKDIMSLSKFGFNAEFVAPDSENTIIPPGAISMYRVKYKSIVTLFDYDSAGMKAAEKFTQTYDIPGVILPLSKDLSDSVRDYGLEKTREVLYPLLKEAINK